MLNGMRSSHAHNRRLNSYVRKLAACSDDLLDIAKAVRKEEPLDSQIAVDLIKIATEYRQHVGHLQELLTIKELLRNNPDKVSTG